MAFDPDAYLAAKKEPAAAPAGGFDPDAYLASKKAPVDMGPEARRARAGMGAGPRELDDVQAGTSGGSLTAKPRTFEVAGRPFGVFTAEHAPDPAGPAGEDYTAVRERHPGSGFGVLGAFGPAKSLTVSQGNPNEMGDPGAQMLTATALGMGTGGGARALGTAAGVPAKLVAPAVSALEGGTVNASLGGDFDTGAALGLVPLAARAAGRAASGANAGRTMTARGTVKEITKGETKAPKGMIDDVKSAAEGGRLTEVLAETPAARRAVTVKAHTNPGGAAADIDKVLDAARNANDEVYAAIQRQHRGIPLQPILDRLGNEAEKLSLQGHGIPARALRRVRAFWEKEFGQGDPNRLLGAQQLRNMRNDLSDVIDPAKALEKNTKQHADLKVRDLLNREIEDVASNTSGVDVEALRANNRRISTLIPVRDALLERAESQADAPFKLKSVPGKVIGRARREAQALVEDIPAEIDTLSSVPFTPSKEKR